MAESDNENRLLPSTVEEVQQCVLAAVTNEEPLEVIGAGSKRYFGHPVNAPRVLSLARLSGIVDYQPQELLVVVRPGTPLRELEQTLAERGQGLAFEPPHWSENATIGGVIGCNLAGPRRPKAGAARDHLLGFQAVTGRGDIVNGGGRVVKNVTGYDLSKLMCGSFGTLAVLTELVVKVLPVAETERTVVVGGLEEAEGLELLIKAARSPYEVSGGAHLGPDAVFPAPVAGLAKAGDAMTFIRVEGPRPSVEHRCEMVTHLTGRQTGYLEEGESRGLWHALRELEPLGLAGDEQLWRFSLPATSASRFALALDDLAGGRHYFDWCGGQVWGALPPDAAVDKIHALAGEHGGHGRRVRAGSDKQAGAFPALDRINHELHVRLKRAFDPEGVLNPGRMYPDL